MTDEPNERLVPSKVDVEATRPPSLSRRVVAAAVAMSDWVLVTVAACFVIAGAAAAGAVASSSGTAAAWLTLAVLAAIPVFVVLSRYLHHRRDQVADYLNGDGRLNPLWRVAVDFAKALVLEGMALGASMFACGAGVVAVLCLPAGVLLTTVLTLWVGLVTVGWAAVPTVEAVVSAVSMWLAVLTPGVAGYLSMRAGLALDRHLAGKLHRFHHWNGVVHVPLVTDDEHGASSWWRMLERADRWFDGRVFPPLPLVQPSYVQLVAGEHGVTPRCRVCGAPVDGDHVCCRQCDTPHHGDCWDYVGGCATFGCGSTAFRAVSRSTEGPAAAPAACPSPSRSARPD